MSRRSRPAGAAPKCVAFTSFSALVAVADHVAAVAGWAATIAPATRPATAAAEIVRVNSSAGGQAHANVLQTILSSEGLNERPGQE